MGGEDLFGVRLFYSGSLALWPDLASLEPTERVGCCRVPDGAVISDQGEGVALLSGSLWKAEAVTQHGGYLHAS